jgi:hypothetical protein
MQISPNIIFGLALFAFVLTFLPDKYRPTWMHRLTWWQVLIGLVAVVAATLIVMNPEFYALGILGDSTFFDLLVLAISLQLQTIVSRIWHYVVLGVTPILRFVSWRLYATSAALLFIFADVVSTVQKVVHRISS